MKGRNLLSGFLAAIITVLLVVSLADGYANCDKEPPKVIYTDPQDESKNVDPQVVDQTGIRIRFGESVVVSHGAVTVDGLDLGWMLVDYGDPYEVFLKKGKKNLPHDAKILVECCVQDYSGQYAEAAFSFTTAPDTEPPYLVWSDPQDGDTVELVKGQSLEIKVVFNELVYCEARLTNLTTGEENGYIVALEAGEPLGMDEGNLYGSWSGDITTFDYAQRSGGVRLCLGVVAWDGAENKSEFTIFYYVVFQTDDDEE